MSQEDIPAPQPPLKKLRLSKEEKKEKALQRNREEDIPHAAAAIAELEKFTASQLARTLALFGFGVRALGRGSALDDLRDILRGDALPNGDPAPLKVDPTVFDEISTILAPIKTCTHIIHPSAVLAVGTDMDKLAFEENGDDEDEDENEEAAKDFFALFNVTAATDN